MTRGGPRVGSSIASAVQEALRPTLADEAYQELKRRIVMIELEPGAQFREADVAVSLGLGKTPVREALLRLRLEGLVHVQSRSGYSVSPITLKSARGVCEFRALLEQHSAQQASLSGNTAAESLRVVEAAGQRTLARLDAPTMARDKEQLAAWIDGERAFHLALARASGNELVTETLSGVLEGFARLCYLAAVLGPGEVIPIHGHESLIAAIESGEPTEAQTRVLEEMRSAENWLLQALVRSESLSTTNVDATPGLSHSFYLDVPPDGHKGGRKA